MADVNQLSNEVRDELLATGQKVQDLQEKLMAARVQRDRAIREAIHQGATRRDVARATGITPDRVQKILDSA